MLGQLFSWHPAARAWPISRTVKPLFRVLCPGSPFRSFTNTHNLLKRRKKKFSFTPSKEQQEIAELCGTENVVVSARPGSGKTRTAEAIVADHPDKRVAVLTYSKRLQLDTHRRLRTYPNCEVLTFHAMACLLFGTLVRDDATLAEHRRGVLERNELPRWDPAPFDIIVLDEFQDCTKLLFWLINCFILANNQKAGGQSARLVVLGDERQSIYEFRGADARYLTLAPDVLGIVSPYPFVRAQLNRSFRLSDQSVRFINNTFLGGESYITSSKPGPEPIILRCSRWGHYALAKQLSALIKRYGAKNTAIIAPAVRKPGPLQDVVNILSVQYRVPIAVSIDDEVPLDDRVIEGKLCVSTIHQFKGSERDLVILFGLDSSFFGYFGRNLPDDRCPNQVFVALTRAAEQLVLVHFEEEELMPFVSVKALYETARVINMTRNQDRIKPPRAPGRLLERGLTLPRRVAVREIARHLKDEHLDAIVHSHLRIQVLSPLPEHQHIKLPAVVISDKGKRFHEAVSDLNGLVVVAALEHEIAGTLGALRLSQRENDTIPEICSHQGVSWLCRRACDHEAAVSGYLPRSIQMANHDFDWIEPDDLAIARSRLRGELSGMVANPRFEVDANGFFSIDDQECKLQECKLFGRADIVTASSNSDGNNAGGVESVWEIKFVSQLSNQHVIQACTYAYLLGIPHVILYNVRNGEKWEITPRDGQKGLRCMIEDVLRLKHTTEGKMSDEEFTEMCAGVSLEVLNLRSQEVHGSEEAPV
ncbi:P-loop containing nucleoside triphosphate hydrolase protein [Apiosordaria backusii]|uniref:P-loop containing nucleoside triphosphate hydrolase protein n=1 Tax=Apiosordaria backusii TaxID=314023 RepID=A0AA40E676_9PEZI|nr:P-loop containing nucleoside triphosphate hydrolase protein [Apiosordaria backusii]